MNRSSATATIVCCARGIGISSTQRDPLAAQFVAPPWIASTLDLFGHSSLLANLTRLSLRALSLGIVDHNTIRMLVIDEYLRIWLRDGCRQVIILGAGLDARYWRMPEFEGVQVFEVDHPASQRTKAALVIDRGLARETLHFVPVDLEADDLSEPLKQAGYQCEEPSAWVCEGVTPYLQPSSIARLWRNAASISAHGSNFILSYIVPTQSTRSATARLLVRLLASRLGEPARGAVSKVEMHAYVEEAGLRRLEDIGWERWKAPEHSYTRFPNLLKERLIVAKQDGGK